MFFLEATTLKFFLSIGQQMLPSNVYYIIAIILLLKGCIPKV